MYSDFATAGVVLNLSSPQTGPDHGLSHAQAPVTPPHTPFSEQSRSDVHADADVVLVVEGDAVHASDASDAYRSRSITTRNASTMSHVSVRARLSLGGTRSAID